MENISVSFIGSGNVATYFAQQLFQNKVAIQQVFSRNICHAETLANSVSAKLCNAIEYINTDVDFIIISVTDSEISKIIPPLNQHGKAIFLHTTASVGLNVFNGFKSFGILYPLQTFTKDIELTNIDFPLFVEANSTENLNKLFHLAQLISQTVIESNYEQRQSLHLAAVFANNFVNHLLNISSNIIENNKLQFNLLQPLLLETISKLQNISPSAAQTGPAKRNDLETIAKHKFLLKNYPQNFSFIYDAITKSIIDKS